jgi:hypothetical protein
VHESSPPDVRGPASTAQVPAALVYFGERQIGWGLRYYFVSIFDCLDLQTALAVSM